MKTTYHLEDKVFLDGIRDDRKEKMQQNPTTSSNERPKRKIIPPRHLRDFA